MLYDLTKKVIKRPFHLFGLDIVRRSNAHKESNTKPERPAPPVFGEPFEALYDKPFSEWDTSNQLVFECALTRIMTRRAFGYGPDSWHPFIETLHEYRAGDASQYSGSVLECYYNEWQPADAQQALFGSTSGVTSKLTKVAPYAAVTPWEQKSPEKRGNYADMHMRRENEEQGYPDFGIDKGYNHFGPVSDTKGCIEYQRLVNVFESIKASGYKRSAGWDGDVGGILLRRGNSYGFLLSHGYHRLAAVAVLGYHAIPVRIRHPVPVDIRDSAYWPQVRRAVWTREQAETYFHHLFDFDSRAWARDRGLSREMDSSLNDPQGEVAGPA